MYVKQISVFLENSTGTLAELTQLLGEKGIDLIALSIADTEHYGILRAIVSDTDKAVSELKNAGYSVKLTDVLAVSVPDKPGGLSVVLEALAEGERHISEIAAKTGLKPYELPPLLTLLEMKKLASPCGGNRWSALKR